ncbi:MAG: MarR family transcriptional regulator [Burkholderiales bacterium]|nr:MarR family transcriptional regulator [Burkholderiales bacterium]
MKHSTEGAATTTLILQVFRVNGLLLGAGDRLIRDLGLTSARWQVLGALSEGPLTAAQIARNMGLKRQSVQRLVDVLDEEGVVRFEDNPHHLRAKLIRMTESGERKYAKVMAIQTGWVNRLSRGLKVADVQTALQVLRAMEARLR